jgi:hypothetical protein
VRLPRQLRTCPCLLLHCAMSLSETARISAAWCLACTALHAALATVLFTARTVPRLQRLSAREQGSLRNSLVAASHAATMFAGASVYMSQYADFSSPLLFRQPRPVSAGNTPTEVVACALMVGYLVYDTLYGMLARANGADMVAHHVLGLAAWLAVLHTNKGGFYCQWVHLAEVRFVCARL